MSKTLLQAAAALSVLLAACTHEPIQLHNELSWDASSLQQTSSCNFSVAGVSNRGLAMDQMGTIGGSPVLASDIAGWVHTAFEQIHGYSPQAQGLSLDVEIVRAYLHSLSISKSANVVVRVNYARSAQVQASRVYRGADTSMNWVNGDIEMQNAFNRALKDMAQQVAKDLGQFCTATPSS